VEANQLGAALLMPRSLVKKELLSNDLNLDDEESIDFLAKRSQVSTAAMSNWLLNLNVLR
jgi:Zn-dependent peptidase ImmA (M78 family)